LSSICQKGMHDRYIWCIPIKNQVRTIFENISNFLGATSLKRNLAGGDPPLTSRELSEKFMVLKRILLNPGSAVLLLISLSVWFLVSYFVVSFFTEKRFAADLQHHSRELNQTAAAVTYHIDRSMAFLRVMPATIADNMVVISALHSFDSQALEKIHAPENKISFLNSEIGLMELNHHLAGQQVNLDVNVIWVLAPSGDCIASSNYDTAESFVGINYSDREYFKSAINGQLGRQYAVGRQTNIPGLFFSAPIRDGENVIGTVVVKIDIPKFSQWIRQFNCFVVDEAGVIILSSDTTLEHHALVDAPIFRMSADARDNRYKRNDFPVLKIGNFREESTSYSTISLPGNSSFYMLSQSQQSSDGYTVFTYTAIREAEQLPTIKWQFTLLVFVSGATLILLIAGIRCYLRDMQDSLALAEAASTAKSQFLANMSHEIRTPMNAIIGMSYLVLQSDLTANQREQVTYLHTAAESLLGIINEILDFSKVEAGKITLEQAPFVLRDTLNEVIHLLKPKLEEKRLEFHYIEHDRIVMQEAPLLIGDALRLRQVLTNLLSNAIKFTEKGFIRFDVSSSSDPDRIRVIFTVEDSGIGMSSEQMPRLFEEFSQADASTTRKYGGTGLGMAIASRLVSLMGGQINVESQPNQGSCFTVEIPFARALMGRSSYKGCRQRVEHHEALRGMRVLLVEDNPVNRLLAVELLAMQGVVTDIAENGEEAVQKLQSLPPGTFGAVLMDLQMPVLDGYETAKIIRADPKFDTLPIIALSAHVMSFEQDRCNQIGINGYINKPFDPEHLWRTLLRAMGKDEPPQAVPSLEPVQTGLEIDINGVILSEGIKRAGGDHSLYLKVLEDVLENFASGCEELLEFAKQGDNQRGHAYAHKLRGAFGAIGAKKMQDAMASIEETFKIGADPSSQILAIWEPYSSLLEALGRYVHAIGTATKPEEKVSANGGPVVDEAWLEAFTAHLATGDFVAVELWETHKHMMGDYFSPVDVEQISRALQQFDFARALEYVTVKMTEPHEET